jgi:glycosidase
MRINLLSLLSMLIAAIFMSCGDTSMKIPTSSAKSIGNGPLVDHLEHPEWSKNATVYEVNIRQHTPEGTFSAFQSDLPRIKSLGVDILWLMPIHPIGELNRKGGENLNNYMVQPGSPSLGSPYSAKNYYEVNPAFGDLDDLRNLVSGAHDLGMKVILDWVANHTAFDSEWTLSNRSFFLLDDAGNLQPPTGTDWWDVTQLDWDKGLENGLFDAMADAMEFWIAEADIDGYRCDVAGKVPTQFWNKARRELERIKPDVFMLAEAEVPEHHDRAFDMSYAWHLHHVMNKVAQNEWSVDSIRVAIARDKKEFGLDAYRLMFVTNHDENSWNGTIAERMGANADAMALLAGTIFGMPLIYSGQEAGMSKRLRFFEKDTVVWGDYSKTEMYQTINALHHEEEALWNGPFGGWPQWISTPYDDEVLAWRRGKNGSEVVVASNFSEDSRLIPIGLSDSYSAVWGDVAPDQEVELPPNQTLIWRKTR